MLLGDEEPGDLALNVHGDEHRTRFCRGLDARGRIGRLAEHFPRHLDYDWPGLEADAGEQFWSASASVLDVDLRERALDGERRPHGSLGVVLLRLRIAEESHQPVAELL